jgi:hypothetical protein
MLIFGVAALILILVSSLSVNAKAENEAWIIANLNDLEPGSAMQTASFWIYHRTKEEAGNDKEQFTFFWDFAPHRGCPIKFVKAQTVSYGVPARDRYANMNHYMEGCDGAIFTTDGIYMQETGNPKERNLIVPKVKSNKKNEYLIYLGRA